MNISLVIPYCDQSEFTERCLKRLVENTTKPVELILIDNQSEKKSYPQFQKIVRGSNLQLRTVRNEKNVGVLETFRQGLKEADGDIVCFIHNDVLIQEKGWNERVHHAFLHDEKLGLAGLFGARGVAPDGGREGVMSHMLGKEWGQTSVQPAAVHHGELMTDAAPVTVFDGVGLFFRRSTLYDLVNDTDMFADWRAPHHFYDRIFTLKVIDLGYHTSVIGIQFDHFSGATANHSNVYHDFAKQWCEDHGHELVENNADLTVYRVAEKQWREEFAYRLPAFVDKNHNVTWRNPKKNG